MSRKNAQQLNIVQQIEELKNKIQLLGNILIYSF